MRTLSILAGSSLSVVLLSHCGDSEPEPCSGSECGEGGAGGAEGGSGGASDPGFDCAPEPVLPAGAVIHSCSTDEGRRCLPEDVLRRRAVAYSGYRTGQDPREKTYPSEEEILADLEMLIDAGFGLIRLFDSGTHGERTLQVIAANELDLKVQLGVWIEGAAEDHDEENQADIARGIALANDYSDIVVGVSVGNETLSSWSSVLTPASDLAEYIVQVRDAIEQPVTTDEMYPPYQLNGEYSAVKEVVHVIDYASVHIYAFIDAQWSWNWKQDSVAAGPERATAMMEAGQKFTRDALGGVRLALLRENVDLPIVLGEIGWKTSPTKPDEAAGEKFRAHPMNQKIFVDWLESWVYGAAHDEDSPSAAFYFEAFDEPWKGQDDGWGLFDVERRPKLVMACDFPELVPEDAPRYTLDDAVYYVAE